MAIISVTGYRVTLALCVRFQPATQAMDARPVSARCKLTVLNRSAGASLFGLAKLAKPLTELNRKALSFKLLFAFIPHGLRRHVRADDVYQNHAQPF